jgi:hypothetical protein
MSFCAQAEKVIYQLPSLRSAHRIFYELFKLRNQQIEIQVSDLESKIASSICPTAHETKGQIARKCTRPNLGSGSATMIDRVENLKEDGQKRVILRFLEGIDAAVPRIVSKLEEVVERDDGNTSALVVKEIVNVH